MPCSSGYLEPSTRERELQRAAKLLVYVYTKLRTNTLRGDIHIAIPAWLTEVANDPYTHDDRALLDLCAILRNMERSTFESIVYNAWDKTSRDLADWWEDHQEADRKREAEELREAQRRAALAKLTPEEREVLGL